MLFLSYIQVISHKNGDVIDGDKVSLVGIMPKGEALGVVVNGEVVDASVTYDTGKKVSTIDNSFYSEGFDKTEVNANSELVSRDVNGQKSYGQNVIVIVFLDKRRDAGMGNFRGF